MHMRGPTPARHRSHSSPASRQAPRSRHLARRTRSASHIPLNSRQDSTGLAARRRKRRARTTSASPSSPRSTRGIPPSCRARTGARLPRRSSHSLPPYPNSCRSTRTPNSRPFGVKPTRTVVGSGSVCQRHISALLLAPLRHHMLRHPQHYSVHAPRVGTRTEATTPTFLYRDRWAFWAATLERRMTNLAGAMPRPKAFKTRPTDLRIRSGTRRLPSILLRSS